MRLQIVVSKQLEEKHGKQQSYAANCVRGEEYPFAGNWSWGRIALSTPPHILVGRRDDPLLRHDLQFNLSDDGGLPPTRRSAARFLADVDFFIDGLELAVGAHRLGHAFRYAQIWT